MPVANQSSRSDKEWASLVKRANTMRQAGYEVHICMKRLHVDWRILKRKAKEFGMQLK